MTSEQRLDRLEGIAMLMARAGLRARRDQNEKINMIIDAQIKNEDRFAQNEKRFAQNEERFAQNEKRFARFEDRFGRLTNAQEHTERMIKELAESHKELAESQKLTYEQLRALIDITGRNQNGKIELSN